MGHGASINHDIDNSDGISRLIKDSIANAGNLPIISLEESDSLILCAKALSLCKLVYRNSKLVKNNADFEEENIRTLQVSDYKIWTYASNAERVLRSISGRPNVSAQCATGTISKLFAISDDPYPFVCFGGTLSLYDVIAELSSVNLTEAKTLNGNTIGKSGIGIVEFYYTLRAFGIIEYIVELVSKLRSGLVISGHGYSATAATLFITELLIDYPNLFDDIPIYLVTFGCPRVFDAATTGRLSSLIKKKPKFQYIRVVNNGDIISMLPPQNSSLLQHIGEVYFLSKTGLEIISTEVDFPPDGDNSIDAIKEFVSGGAQAHQIGSDAGYFSRLILSNKFASILKKMDAKSLRDLSKLSVATDHSSVPYSAKSAEVSKSFVDHFFAKEKKLVDCKMWYNISDESFLYPEQRLPEMQAKADFGIALSGGGLRAACLSLGWLRALHQLGLLQKAKYMSSNSGGGWVHVPLSYNPKKGPHDTETFLGPYLPPEKCTVKAVEDSVSEGHGSLLANSDFVPSLIKELFEEKFIPSAFHHSREVDFWSQTVGKAYLAKHGFDVHGSSLPALEGDHAERIRELTKGLVDNIYTARPLESHPYPIVNGSVLVGSERGCVPVEFTPLYYGIVHYYEDDHRGIGGCLIEPHGFTAKPETAQFKDQVATAAVMPAKQNHCMNIKVFEPPFPLTLHEMTGISSSFLAQTKGDKLDDAQYEKAHYPIFPTFTYKCPEDVPFDRVTSREKFVDGGSCDNTGVIALLRRKCTFIVSCVAMNNPMNITEPALEDANGHAMSHVAALFGRQHSSTKIGNYVIIIVFLRVQFNFY